MKKHLLNSAITLLLMLSLPLTAVAHSGRTDSSGGHRDNKNKSGLGSYHYHCGGYPPHLHSGGICPYSPGYSSSRTVTPKKVYATKITPVNIPQKVNVGESVQLKGSVYPTNAEDNSITWSSDTPEIAGVTRSGTLHPIRMGTAIIVATTDRGTSSKFPIKIDEICAAGITIQDKPSTLTLKETFALTVGFTPTNTTYKNINWASSNDSVAKVYPDGRLTAVGVGTATITATHKELQDSFQVEILPIKAESINISETALLETTKKPEHFRVNINTNVSLTAIIAPYNTTDKSIEWLVDNEEIATIDVDGNLTFLSSGTIKVTAKTENGKTDTITIEIYSYTPLLVGGGITCGIGALSSTAYILLKKKRHQ